MRENGPGVDFKDNQYITIHFSKEQTIDSVILLSNSNVQSYSIYYSQSDGSEYVLADVNIRFRFCYFI